MSSVLIAGGAGFVGSHIADRFINSGWAVRIVDGLMPRTGGRAPHVDKRAQFTPSRVEDAGHELEMALAMADLVVDAMGWTSHNSALKDPEYDLALNVGAHLALLRALRATPRPVIYLGSRTQYGRPAVAEITEDTPMMPEDVQGLHKVAAEGHFRIASKFGLPAVSLRFPNCFGERMPTQGDDIGLIGSMIRDFLRGDTVEIYGAGRRRSIVYAGDVAEVVFRVASAGFTSFAPYNISGTRIAIEELSNLVQPLAGGGRIVNKPMPSQVAAIESGDSPVSDQRLQNWIGPIPQSDLHAALCRTVEYMRREILDLAM